MEILPEMGRLGIFFGKYDIILGYCRLKKSKFDIFSRMSPKHREDLLNFEEHSKLNIVLLKHTTFQLVDFSFDSKVTLL